MNMQLFGFHEKLLQIVKYVLGETFLADVEYLEEAVDIEVSVIGDVLCGKR
jgi:hypothetical protein